MCNCNCNSKFNNLYYCNTYCNKNIKAIINPLTITTNNTSIPLIITYLKNSCNPDILLGTNTINLNKIGIYNIKGYVDIINQSINETNFQIVITTVMGTNIINPHDIMNNNIKSNTPIKIYFNFNIQTTTPNNIIQLFVNTTSVPVIISSGKINISKKD